MGLFLARLKQRRGLSILGFLLLVLAAFGARDWLPEPVPTWSIVMLAVAGGALIVAGSFRAYSGYFRPQRKGPP
jgi:cyanate permease